VTPVPGGPAARHHLVGRGGQRLSAAYRVPVVVQAAALLAVEAVIGVVVDLSPGRERLAAVPAPARVRGGEGSHQRYPPLSSRSAKSGSYAGFGPSSIPAKPCARDVIVETPSVVVVIVTYGEPCTTSMKDSSSPVTGSIPCSPTAWTRAAKSTSTFRYPGLTVFTISSGCCFSHQRNAAAGSVTLALFLPPERLTDAILVPSGRYAPTFSTCRLPMSFSTAVRRSLSMAVSTLM